MQLTRVRAIVASVLLAPYVAAAAVPAPEHLHEADADHQSAIHQHLRPHQLDSHDHDHARLADDDDHVVWLEDAVALHQATYHLPAPAVTPTTCEQFAPAIVDRASPPDYDTAPPHGPPRTGLSLRAPPSFA